MSVGVQCLYVQFLKNNNKTGWYQRKLHYAFSYPCKLHWFRKEAHHHNIKSNIAHCLQPLGDKLGFEFFHQAAHFIIHHVCCGMEPLKDHADKPCQALCRGVLARGAEAHLENKFLSCYDICFQTPLEITMNGDRKAGVSKINLGQQIHTKNRQFKN